MDSGVHVVAVVVAIDIVVDVGVDAVRVGVDGGGARVEAGVDTVRVGVDGGGGRVEAGVGVGGAGVGVPVSSYASILFLLAGVSKMM